MSLSIEKKRLLERVNDVISTKKKFLNDKMPIIHELDDGIVIRYFHDWFACDDNALIKYKIINSINNPDETIIFFMLPKNAIIELKERSYISCITCLNGKLEINDGDKKKLLEPYSKICLENNNFEGIALEDSYIITTNIKH